jgi:hypothetical protein
MAALDPKRKFVLPPLGAISGHSRDLDQVTTAFDPTRASESMCADLESRH